MLTQEALKEILHYDCETGKFTWLISTSNRVKVGAEAGSKHSMGYREIQLFGERYLLHRLAWLYEYDKLPDVDIDHINGIKHDNRICNLREVTDFGNMQNMRKPTKRNKHDLLGVSYDMERNKFKAQIMTNGVSKQIGRYDTKEQAHAAYLKAKRELHNTCTI